METNTADDVGSLGGIAGLTRGNGKL